MKKIQPIIENIFTKKQNPNSLQDWQKTEKDLKKVKNKNALWFIMPGLIFWLLYILIFK